MYNVSFTHYKRKIYTAETFNSNIPQVSKIINRLFLTSYEEFNMSKSSVPFQESSVGFVDTEEKLLKQGLKLWLNTIYPISKWNNQ